MTITIIKPHITENSISKAKNGKYTFEIALTANKNSVQVALESLYKVKVGSVRTITRLGKIKTAGKSRKLVQSSNKKYAIVSLKSGKIDSFPTE